MPTYQYACTECGHAFEQFQSFSDDALTVCPRCEGRLRKVYNAVGVVFKGSGFYRTDSRTDGDKAKPSGTGDHSGSTDGSTAPAGDGGGSTVSTSDSGSGATSTSAGSGGDKAGSGAGTTGSTSAA